MDLASKHLSNDVTVKKSRKTFFYPCSRSPWSRCCLSAVLSYPWSLLWGGCLLQGGLVLPCLLLVGLVCGGALVCVCLWSMCLLVLTMLRRLWTAWRCSRLSVRLSCPLSTPRWIGRNTAERQQVDMVTYWRGISRTRSRPQLNQGYALRVTFFFFF